MKGYRQILSCFFIMILLLSFLHYRVDIYSSTVSLFSYLKTVHMTDMVIALGLYILSVYIFALRWKTVLNSLGYKLKARSLFPIIFGAIPINNLTPANRAGGEPLRMLWVKKDYGVTYPDSLVSILFERAVEAIPVGLMAIYVFYLILPFCQNIFKWAINLGYLTLVFVALIFLVYLFRDYIIRLSRSLLSQFVTSLKKYSEKLSGAFLSTLFFSSAVWVLDVMRLKFITMALGLHVSVSVLLLISVLYLLLGSIPLTPGGLGIVEGGLVAALGFFGMPMITASAIVVLERTISYVIASAIGSFYLIRFGGLTFWKSIRSQ
nr:lysylphosphatidylglycerol synthase transmembrane domain-containing protein [Methanolobus vulcani]